jgi:phosphoribosylaminoimidazolecarboxamide formyltransferase/IMP cyclohydrolase
MTARPLRRVLLSVEPFSGLIEVGSRLRALGAELIATRSAAQALSGGGIEVRDVAEFVGVTEQFPFPPTLHPRMELALSGPSTLESSIDLVFDIPYELEHGQDVGGHTLLALAAKGNRLTATSEAQLRAILEQLEGSGTVSDELRSRHQRQVHEGIAAMHLALARDCRAETPQGTFTYSPVRRLESGENPYQQPAWLAADTSNSDILALHRWEQRTGPAPCYTNLADIDTVLDLYVKLRSALDQNSAPTQHICIAAKHGIPTGIGMGEDPEQVIEAALFGDPLSIWGGEVLVNFALSDSLSSALSRSERRMQELGSPYWMLDVVLAPHADDSAIDGLSRNKRRKVFLNPAIREGVLDKAPRQRQVRGGALLQSAADYVLDLSSTMTKLSSWPLATQREACLAWAVAFGAFCGGNEVAIAKDGQLLGLGGGPSTVLAAERAIERAQSSSLGLEGATFAADAFFPMEDAPRLLIEAGCRFGVVPGGGKRHMQIVAQFADADVSVAFLAPEHRGFCRH